MKKYFITIFVFNILLILNSIEKLPITSYGTLEYDGQSISGYQSREVKSLNEIISLYSKEELLSVKQLIVNRSQITKIENLNDLENLEILNLDFNQIDFISNLDNLRKLKELDLSGNKIEKIEGLENLTNLKILALDNNNISKIEGLEKLTKIEEIYLSKNNISKIENVNQLINIKFPFHFKINNNPLKKIDNKSLDYFKSINLIENKYYIKIDNLLFRSNYGTKSDIIRKLSKNECLYLLPGSSREDDIINGVKGKWCHVISEKNEIGWCFDAYLDEVIIRKIDIPEADPDGVVR